MFKRLWEILFGEIVPPIYKEGVTGEGPSVKSGGGGSTCVIVVGAAGGGGNCAAVEESGKRVPTSGITLTLPAGYEVGRNVTVAGYVLVPVEPTEAMIEAFLEAKFRPADERTYLNKKEDFVERYKSMIGVVRK